MLRIALLTAAMISSLTSGDWTVRGVSEKAKPAPQPPAVFQGTVALVTNSQLVLATRSERRTFVVPTNALVVVNRVEASISDVVPGQFASVASNNTNGQLVANFIHASRQY